MDVCAARVIAAIGVESRGGVWRHDRQMSVAKKISSFRRYGPAIFTWSMLFGTSGVFYVVVIPEVLREFHIAGLAFVMLDMLLMLGIVSNHFMSIAMDPGVLPRATESEELQHDVVRVPWYKNLAVRGIRVRSKWCETCHFYRPPRCTHCSACDHCMDTFDHHCPFLNNCVARRNYCPFFVFISLSSLHILVAFALCIAYTIKSRENIVSTTKIASIIVVLICSTLGLVTILLFGYHFVLVVRARSTFEQCRGKFRKGYNPFSGGMRRNLAMLCCRPSVPSLVGRLKGAPKVSKS